MDTKDPDYIRIYTTSTCYTKYLSLYLVLLVNYLQINENTIGKSSEIHEAHY